MIVKYNRVSTLNQSGERFKADSESYDKVILDKVSGTVPFKEREGGKEVVSLVEKNILQELVLEELSRCGRNTGDVIQTLEWLEDNKVNVRVRNIGLESRPGGKKNPIWKMITSVMSSLYEMELENIKERTHYGRIMYVKNGGKLGRPSGTSESAREFLDKPTSKRIKNYLEDGLSIRDTAKVVGCSTSTVQKVKQVVSDLNSK
ncbi:recombinase family protein [Balneola sp. MJW-20]|uniref:recombinase family protein n=1 Tax=Gracilimonas aurantiaca TaxID=3234185 RepID=UPI0034676446